MWCPYIKGKLGVPLKGDAEGKLLLRGGTGRGGTDQRPSEDGSWASETEKVNKRLWAIWTIGMAAVILFAALSVGFLGWELKYVLVFLVFVSIFAAHLSTYARKRTNSPWEPSYHRIGPDGVETYKGWKETRRTRLRTRK